MTSRLTVLTTSRIPEGSGDTRVLMTTDGGRRFHAIGPSVPRAFAPDDVYFLDRTHGWLTASDLGGRELIFRTADAGRTWRRAALPFAGPAAGSTDTVDFVSPRDGWLASLDPAGPEEVLYRTRDGGAHWHHIASFRQGGLPQLGLVEFTGPSTGWLGGTYFAVSALDVTHDRGRTWSRSPIPATAVSVISLPAIFGRQLVESVSSCVRGILDDTVYASGDGGRHWRARSRPARLGESRQCSTSVATAFASPDSGWSVALHRLGLSVYRTTDAGRRWHRVRQVRIHAAGQPRIKVVGGNVWLTVTGVHRSGTRVYTLRNGDARAWHRVDGAALHAPR